MKPEMIVIAGPSGSGKSRHFGAQTFGIEFFNVDDRCADLNGGSYQTIPPAIRAQAQRECEQFINDCTMLGTSFAVETTLRSAVAVEQAERARAAGFTIKMIFVATDNVDSNVRRVVRRGLDGGHCAPAERIVEIYHRSLANLPHALAVFDEVALYDSSAHDKPPRLVRVYDGQQITFEEPPIPAWLTSAIERSQT
jgi:predicted ABC-type ATPase